jgi:hypothetical protein
MDAGTAGFAAQNQRVKIASPVAAGGQASGAGKEEDARRAHEGRRPGDGC